LLKSSNESEHDDVSAADVEGAEDGSNDIWKETNGARNYEQFVFVKYHIRGLVVRVSGYRCRGSGFDSRRFQIFCEAACLERGPLSLTRTTEELLEGKVAAPV
jgi:hypothetical protein